jgi:hypothetical protein
VDQPDRLIQSHSEPSHRVQLPVRSNQKGTLNKLIARPLKTLGEYAEKRQYIIYIIDIMRILTSNDLDVQG